MSNICARNIFTIVASVQNEKLAEQSHTNKRTSWMCNTLWAALGHLQANCCYITLLQSPWLGATSLMHPSSGLLLLSLPVSPHSMTLSFVLLLCTQQLLSPLTLCQLPAGLLLSTYFVTSSGRTSPL